MVICSFLWQSTNCNIAVSNSLHLEDLSSACQLIKGLIDSLYKGRNNRRRTWPRVKRGAPFRLKSGGGRSMFNMRLTEGLLKSNLNVIQNLKTCSQLNWKWKTMKRETSSEYGKNEESLLYYGQGSLLLARRYYQIHHARWIIWLQTWKELRPPISKWVFWDPEWVYAFWHGECIQAFPKAWKAGDPLVALIIRPTRNNAVGRF